MALKVTINKTGLITISITKTDIKRAAIGLQDFEHYDEETGEFLVPKITDALIFTKEVCRRLNDEEEDGTTIVHRMFDEAFKEAVEQGAEGIVFPEDKEYGRKVFAR